MTKRKAGTKAWFAALGAALVLASVGAAEAAPVGPGPVHYTAVPRPVHQTVVRAPMVVSPVLVYSPPSVGSTRSRAERLDRGRDVTGHVEPRGEHWLELRLSTEAHVEAEIRLSDAARCELLDDRGGVLASQQGNRGRGCDLEADIAQGSYYIRLSGHGSRPLAFEVEYDTERIRDDHGDTPSRAYRIARGRAVAGFLARNDRDFFELSSARGRTRVRTESAQGTDTICVVYDARGREVARDDNRGGNRQCEVSFNGNGGRYYVEVRGGSYTAAGGYALRWD